MGNVIRVNFFRESAESLHDQATTCMEDGLLTEAQALYEKVLALEPDHLTTLVNLGCILYDNGDTKSAEKHWITALSIAPHDMEALYNLGCMYLHNSEYRAALVCLTQLSSVDHDFEDVDESIAYLKEGLELK